MRCGLPRHWPSATLLLQSSASSVGRAVSSLSSSPPPPLTPRHTLGPTAFLVTHVSMQAGSTIFWGQESFWESVESFGPFPSKEVCSHISSNEMSEDLSTWSPSVEPSPETTPMVQNPCTTVIVLASCCAPWRRNEFLTNGWHPLIYISPWLELLFSKAGSIRDLTSSSLFTPGSLRQQFWVCVCLFCSSRLSLWPALPQNSESGSRVSREA